MQPSIAEKNLSQLLKTMQPALLEGSWAFVTVPKGRALPAGITPLMTCQEPEGLSLILSEADVLRSGLPHAFFCKCISITVHSSLYSVGFLATVSAALAKAAMSINIVSAYHRDYLFVPTNRADEAVALLKKLATEAK
jgi:hypothetical protein